MAWAVRLPLDAAAAAGALRLRAIRACVRGEALWLHGEEFSEELEAALRRLPGAVCYAVQPDGALLRQGCRVPQGELPAEAWAPLRELLRPEPPQAALPGALPELAQLELVRCGEERPANLLEADLTSFAAWAVEAPQVRLDPLGFAANAEGRVLVRGAPLPPIPGTRWHEQHGVAVPCGWTWLPAVGAEILRQLFLPEAEGSDRSKASSAAGALILLDPDGRHRRIPGDAFVAARRSAVRQTLAAREAVR